MVHKDFMPPSSSKEIKEGRVTWQSPSNIALVKYWGKREEQLPANPSLSFTLDTSRTTTALVFTKMEIPAKEPLFELYFEGKKKEDFKPKIKTFFNRIKEYCPYLLDYRLIINSENSFPHSSGIASSASGMSALALCIMSMEKELFPQITADDFFKKASFLARLGSGSACRSCNGSIVVWGKHEEIENSSDLYGVEFTEEVHPVFDNFQDTILLVDKGAKQVSSSIGHELMHSHPFAEERFKQAHKNLSSLKDVFRKGDLEAFIEIVESEALTLHAMMMSSKPYFILIKPNTLEIINKIWAFREKTGLPVCFTLDAGANVHILYPQENKSKVFEFIKNELVVYCENEQYLCDWLGKGAIQIF